MRWECTRVCACACVRVMRQPLHGVGARRRSGDTGGVKVSIAIAIADRFFTRGGGGRDRAIAGTPNVRSTATARRGLVFDARRTRSGDRCMRDIKLRQKRSLAKARYFVRLGHVFAMGIQYTYSILKTRRRIFF